MCVRLCLLVRVDACVCASLHACVYMYVDSTYKYTLYMYTVLYWMYKCVYVYVCLSVYVCLYVSVFM